MRVCPTCGGRFSNTAAHCPEDGSALEEVRDPRLGALVAERFVLEAVLGEGASATVYRARHAAANKPVAVKVLRRQQADRPEVRARFLAAYRREEAADVTLHWQTSEIRERERWRTIVTETLAGVADPGACYDFLFAHFANPDAWKLSPDAPELLTALTARGFVLGMGSNYDERLHSVLAGFPDTRRTWLRFRDGAFSGCNLFLLAETEGAARAVGFWRRVEAERKRPLAMARLLGPLTLLRFALGRLALRDALDALERRCGARLAAVEMPFADAAVDVDKPADLALAEAALRARRA